MPGPWLYRLEITDYASKEIKKFRPPAPAFYAKVSYAGNLATVPALIDTGADFSVIPHKVAILLGLRQFSEKEVIGSMGGDPQTRPIFKADLTFLDFSISNQPLVSLERRIHMLIGRDILNQYKTVFDGPNLQFNFEKS